MVFVLDGRCTRLTKSFVSRNVFILPDSMHKLCEDTLIQTCALRNDVYNRAENDLRDSIQFNTIQFKSHFNSIQDSIQEKCTSPQKADCLRLTYFCSYYPKNEIRIAML